MSDISQLARKVAKYRKAYYAGEPLVTDDVYDEVEDKLRKLAPDNVLFKTVGAAPSNTLLPVKHTTFVGSLNNAFDEDGIAAWVQKVEVAGGKRVIVMPKMDGMSVQASYRGGRLVHVATRGDGNTGEDVTANIIASGFPQTIDEVQDLDVRGEAVIHKDDFLKYLASEGYSNERNAAAGIVRSKRTQHAHLLKVYVFDVVPHKPEDTDWFKYLKTTLFWAADSGFVVVPFSSCAVVVEDITQQWVDALAARPDLPYLADGMVARVSSRSVADSMGWSDTCPRYALACKWRGQMVAETEIVGLENSVGRTGVITPVAILKPVDCGGVTVRNASLMNWDEIGRLNAEGHKVGIGSRVRIERCGDVIPRVITALSSSPEPFARPEECPSCRAETFADSMRQVCRNPDCPAQTFRRVMNWVKSRDIKGLGEQTVDLLMSVDGPVANIADLYRVTEDQMNKACKGSRLVAEKVMAALEASRDCTPAQLIGCVGLRGIGVTEADKIVAAFSGTVCSGLDIYRKLLDAWECPNVIAKAVGPVKGKRFTDGVLADSVMIRELYKVLRVAVPVKTAKVTGSAWSGLSFCATGPSEVGRDKLKKIIGEAGGVWKSSVVNGLDILITLDPDSGSVKNREAVKKGVRVISEHTALDMAGYT